MNAKCLFMLLVVSAMCTIYCVHGDNQSPPSVVTTPMSATPPPSRTTDDNGNFNQTELMLACNETFHTSMEYLVELNTTGSFPDETDKTPMCFVKCYLEKTGILNGDGYLIRERAIQLNWATSEETLDECETQSRNQTNPCWKAYALTKCIMTSNLVDSRKMDD